MLTRRLWVGLVLAGVAVVAVAMGRQTPVLSDHVPGYRQKGDAGAKVVITEYSDFQCPRCAEAQPVLEKLLAQYAGQTRLVFRHFPLRGHAWAAVAARAAEAAGQQGKFWAYADLLYGRQKEWSVSPDPVVVFRQYATELGLDGARFASDMDGEKVRALVDGDRTHGESLPIAATPTFFINERVVVGDTQLAAVGARFVELELAE